MISGQWFQTKISLKNWQTFIQKYALIRAK